MQVERTDFISVPVTDLQRSTKFYAETLELPWINEGGAQEVRAP
jgi:catechol 2,3-dioxygenase-like lactoylglutathione lyase family enzyme